MDFHLDDPLYGQEPVVEHVIRLYEDGWTLEDITEATGADQAEILQCITAVQSHAVDQKDAIVRRGFSPRACQFCTQSFRRPRSSVSGTGSESLGHPEKYRTSFGNSLISNSGSSTMSN